MSIKKNHFRSIVKDRNKIFHLAVLLIFLSVLVGAQPIQNVLAAVSFAFQGRSLLDIPPRPTFTCEDTVRIMPLGDSITYDNYSGDSRPSSERTGYRSHLWWELEANGYNVDFVGNVVAGEAVVPAFDPDNEGHPGWTDSQIADNIYGWLEITPADIILLHIGTNGLDSSPNDVEDILDEVDRWESDNSQHITMIVARIINRASYSSTTTAFNDNVEAMALDRVNNASNDAYPDDIIMVDLEDGAGIDYSTDMVDTLHPTDTGYQKMALGTPPTYTESWYSKLTESVNGSPPLLPPCSEMTCPSDMLAYLKLDETSGSIFDDFFDGHDASCESGHCPGFSTAGLLNGALDFNGTSQWITIPDDDELDWSADSSFSIELWANLTNCESRNKVMIGRDNTDDGGTHWWLGCSISGNVTNFNLLDTNRNGVAVSGTTPINDGNWHHIVAIRDNTLDENRIYIDGELEGTASWNYTAGFDAPTALGIGYMAYNLIPDYYYDGLLDEIALYNRVITQSEITDHYNGGTGKSYCSTSLESPVITSTPVLDGQVSAPYSYDVDASGNPAPTYSLTDSPTGMIIDSSTGLIEWTPTAEGDFSVTVEATNSEGSDTQTFVIAVTEAPPFVLRINSGGSTVIDGDTTWVSSATYVTDGSDFTFGFSSVDTTTNVISSPIPPFAVLNSCRHQDHTFDFSSVPDGDYHVRIIWVDKYIGDRAMTYQIEGVTVLEDWNIVDAAGGTGIAVEREFDVTVSDGNGMQIVALKASGNDVFEAAIEIVARGNEAPLITSSPYTSAEINVHYTYDVDASGNPLPTYVLTTAPTGMVIDSSTGLIEWTPTAEGDFDVMVEAINTEGTDVQAFTVSVSPPPACTSDMIAYLKLDETSGSIFSDYYDGHDASCISGHCPDFGTGIVEGALDFNGTDQWIDMPDHIELDWGAEDSFSIELWANLSNCDSRNKVMIGRDENGGTHWWLGCSSSTKTAYLNLKDSTATGPAALVGTTQINDGEWHYIVAVRDNSTNQNFLYVDGVLEASVMHDYTADFGTSTALGIGYMAYHLTPDYYYDGLLDEVALYSKALSQAEILNHYNNGSGKQYCSVALEAPFITSSPVVEGTVGSLYVYDVEATGNPAPTFSLTTSPTGMTINSTTGVIEWTPTTEGDYAVTVEAANAEGTDTQDFIITVLQAPLCPMDIIAYYPLDEVAGPPFEDTIGGNNADCSGSECPTSTTGIVSNAQSFDGNDNISAPDIDSLEWTTESSFSIELWAKMDPSDSCAGNDVMIGRDGSGNLHWWVGCLNSSNLAYFGLRDNSGHYEGTTSSTAVNDGVWHHIVAVRDNATDQNRIYVDGSLQGTTDYDYSGGFAGSAPLSIGSLNTGYRFKGQIDEVAVYDRSLTETEILTHYNEGSGCNYCKELTPTIVSLPVTDATEGILYNYDVDATGNPAPTFTLNIAPAGMTIDANSGLISWLSPTLGDHDVEVEALNSEGSDTQVFVISVTEAPAYALRINCGGPTMVDGAITWEDDDPYISGGSDYTFSTSSVDTTTNSIADPIPPLDVYKTVRHTSPHTYDFSEVPDGDYLVRIHWTDQATSAGGRQIDYDIEGVRVEEDWDIFAEAGGTFIAIDKVYEVTVSDGNGMQITSSAASGDAFESAIEIVAKEYTAPTITSTPVTDGVVGVPFSYDVEATGYPAPIYSLTLFPTDMTIDSATGVIEWTPSSAGDFNVTVEATNSEGSDTQSFSIHVESAPVCPLDMVSYWKMDDTSIPPLVDSYGNNDGTCSGGNCPTPGMEGIVNDALSFAGDDEIEVADHPSLKWGAADSLTVETWVKTTQDCTGNKVFIGKHKNTGEAYWWLGCTDDSGTVEFQFADSEGVGSGLSYGAGVNDDSWHHIAAVISRDENTVYLYVDGDLKNSVAHTFTGDFSSTRPLHIGHYLNSYHYIGLLDEVALYSRALSEAEILTHYNEGLVGNGYCQGAAPAIVSTPVTDGVVGVSYVYDVEVTGNPEPTYSLTEYPTGMTIDPNTGVIEWTPSSAGDFNVTVEATNSEGSDTQSFVISVVELQPCTSSMTSFFHLDEATSPYNDSILGLQGTCTNCPTSVTGLVANGQQFDGVNDEVNVAADPSFDWGKDDSFSVEFWVWKDTACTGNEVIVGRDDSVSSLHIWIGCNSNGTANFQLRDTSGGGDSVASVATLNNGQWHHVAAVRNGVTDTNTIYLDGTPASINQDYEYGFESDTEPLNIGFLNLSGHYRFDGLLDEVVIYNRALSQTEVQDHVDNPEILSSCTPAPMIYSTPLTTGLAGTPYTYTVEAHGNPAPQFGLDSGPAGMTIDSNSGLVEWLVPTAGDHSITVSASNLHGTDTQTYTLSITSSNQPPEITETGPVDIDMSKDGNPIIFELTLNATDPDSDPIEWSILIAASHGTATAAGVGESKEIDFIPDTGFVGDDSFVVQVTDNNGGFDEITVQVHVFEAHSIGLVAGWNLVSFTLQPIDTSIETLLSNIDSEYSLVYAWDGDAKEWLKYDPAVGFGNTLDTLNESQGFWINMNVADNLIVTGTAPTETSIAMYSGWNLVGYPSIDNRSLPDGLSLNGIPAGELKVVMVFHAMDGVDPWKMYDHTLAGVAPYVNDLDEMTPGWGYWVELDSNQTWLLDFDMP